MKFILIIIIVGLSIYFNSLQNGFLLDDEEQILNNKLVHSVTNLSKFFFSSTFNSGGSGDLVGMYYRPMMSGSFSLLYSFFGPNAFYFHLFSLIIHILNTILVFLIFKNFFTQIVALILSLIFLAHPINSETVNYISTLQDLLSFLFGSLAIVLQKRSRKNSIFILSMILLLFALFSKESAILFIVVLIIKIWLFEKTSFLRYFLGGVAVISTYLVVRLQLAQVSFSHDWIAPISQADFLTRLLTIPKELVYYLNTFIFPKDLSFSHHFLVSRVDLGNFYIPLIIVGTLLLGLFSFGKNLMSNKTQFKIYLFFCGWLFFGLLIHLNIFPLDMSVADHWFYTPIVGLLGILGITATTLYQRRFQLFFTLFTILIIISLTARTIVRNFDWKDGLTLYKHDVLVTPDSFDIQNNLARELLRDGSYEQAKIHAQKSIELISNYWVSWNNLGVIYLKLNQIDEAKAAFEKSLTFSDFYQSFENLSGLLFLYNDSNTARIFTQKALEKFPLNAKLWFNLSLIEYKLNHHNQAIEAIIISYQLHPLENTLKIKSQMLKKQPLNLKITDYH